MEIWSYIKNLFENHIFVAAGVVWATIASFLFPEEAYLTAAGAVLGMMVLDLITRLYALSKQNGGFRKAIKGSHITSCAFAKGTTDKLLIFGVMLTICGFAYKISPISAISTWFMQVVFTLMFLRDVLSIIENLMDAGVSGLSVFKKVIKKKMDSYVDSGGDSDTLKDDYTASSSSDSSSSDNSDDTPI